MCGEVCIWMGARGVGHEADTMYTVCSVGRVLVVCENKNGPEGLLENKRNHRKELYYIWKEQEIKIMMSLS